MHRFSAQRWLKLSRGTFDYDGFGLSQKKSKFCVSLVSTRKMGTKLKSIRFARFDGKQKERSNNSQFAKPSYHQITS